MKKKRSSIAVLGMIGSYLNIVWFGIVLLFIFIRIALENKNSELGLLGSILFVIFSSLTLNFSSKYDTRKDYGKYTFLFTILLIVNSLIFSLVISTTFMEILLVFLFLIGPGIFLLIPSSYLQLKKKEEIF